MAWLKEAVAVRTSFVNSASGVCSAAADMHGMGHHCRATASLKQCSSKLTGTHRQADKLRTLDFTSQQRLQVDVAVLIWNHDDR